MPDRPLQELAHMIAEVELDDVRCFGVSARARSGFELPEPPGDDEDSAVQVSVRLRVRPDTLGVRIRAEVLTIEAQVVLHYDALYTAPRVLEYEPSLIGAFVAHVAIPTVFPFLREGLAETTRRIGVKPQLLAALQPPPDEEWVQNLTEQAAALLAATGRDSGEDREEPRR